MSGSGEETATKILNFCVATMQELYPDWSFRIEDYGTTEPRPMSIVMHKEEKHAQFEFVFSGDTCSFTRWENMSGINRVAAVYGVALEELVLELLKFAAFVGSLQDDEMAGTYDFVSALRTHSTMDRVESQEVDGSWDENGMFMQQ